MYITTEGVKSEQAVVCRCPDPALMRTTLLTELVLFTAARRGVKDHDSGDGSNVMATSGCQVS